MTEQQQPLADARPDVPRTVLQAEQARLLYAGIPVSLAVNALIASILVAVQHSVLNVEPIMAWCTLLGVTLVLRAVFAVNYRHARTDELASEIWLTRFRIGTATTGIAWGLASFLLFPANDITYQSFLILAIAGMTAGAVTSLSIDLVSSLAFIIPALVPLIARLLAEGGEIPLAMGAMGTLYLVALTLNARRTCISIRENICLRLEAVTREHDLRESEERLRLIMGTITEVFWMADIPVERMYYISPAYKRVWGRTTESLYENPRSFIEAIHPEDVQRVLSDLEVEKTGQPFDHEYRLVRPDGTIRWVWDRGFPVRDETGKVTRYAGIAQDITEHKRMEQEILRINAGLEERVKERTKELEQAQMETGVMLRRYRTLMLTSMDGIHIMDVQGNIVEANDAFCNMLGYTMEEVLDLNVIAWEAQHSAEELREEFKNFIGKCALLETLYRRKDGALINVEVSVNGVEMEGMGLLFASSRDITARKLAAIALEEKEHHLRQAQSIAHIGSWGYDITLDQLKWSDELYRIYGVSPEVFTPNNESFINLIHSDDQPAMLAWIGSCVSGQKPEAIEFRCVWPDGAIRYIEGQVDLTSDAEGKPTHLSGTARDITEQKRAEFALRKNEAKLRAYMSNISDIIMLVNASLNIIYVSPSVTHLLGLLPEDMTGQQAGFFIHPDDMGVIATAMSYVIEHPGEPHTIQHRVRHKDGRWIYVETTGVNMAGNPAINGVLAVMRDITERKKVEEQLRIAAVSFETHEAILITDADANIIRVNHAFTAITGYSQEEVLGKNPRILSSGRQDKAFYAAMWQQLLSAGSWTGEMWDKRKNGQIYPKWLTITAVKDAAGKTTQYVASFNDITERKKAEEEIHNLAFYDALTRLPNRRLLLDRFHLALSMSARSNHYGAVLFLDMDKFKLLNDTLGHDYGDLMLVEVAQRIQSCVREVETVARLGGDEFVVLIEEISDSTEDASQKVALIAEKIRASLSAPYQLKDHEHHSSPSIGVCLYRGNEEPVGALLKHADMAMYQAKDSGRNTVRFFDPAMQYAVEMHAALEADLRHAVADKQLHLYYQIQLDNDQRPLGAEAMVRWIHPKRGMVSPAQFIPIAEESSLILDIGHWVLETVCRQLKEWSKREQTRHLEIAVNISAQQFRLVGFVDKVAAMVRIHQVNPARLKLELSERVILTDIPDVVAKMNALKALGIKLAMDNFGTGYSSLSYLNQLPLDQIKIDQSLKRVIATDLNDAVMVQTIINMAQNFCLNVIAEGVETEAQLDFLKLHGCMAYQGYLFSKPVPIEEFEGLLKGDSC